MMQDGYVHFALLVGETKNVLTEQWCAMFEKCIGDLVP
jgi:hypothetical protein